MKSKILDFSKKVIILAIVVLLCSSSTASAFSFGTQTKGNERESLASFLSRLFSSNSYDLKALDQDLTKLQNSNNIDLNKINELINKLPSGEDKNILEFIVEMFKKSSEGTSNIDLSSLINKLKEAISSLLGKVGNIVGGTSLPVEPTSIYMNATTAGEFAGADYNVKLHANVYMHVDENGKEDSDKWVLLVHPFLLKGQTIAKKIGPYYYEKGYNILAPDLRSFGESEGDVALGFLESLDVYDWLCKLNNEYNVKQVFVHGISLGGATTNFLSGIDGFITNGPTKINVQMKSLRELKVVALVEDCGYTNMTEFEDKKSLLKRGIGLTDENFDYYADATNSLKYCDLPILIIHGTRDTTVKPENANIVKNTVKGETEQWLVDGASHAFIIIGSKSDEYKSHVQAFIDKYADNSTISKPIDTTNSEKEPVHEDKTDTESTSFLMRIINKIKSLGK